MAYKSSHEHDEEDVKPSLQKIEAACTRAEALEKRLSETADRLALEGENTQRKIERLLNGLDVGDTLQSHLQECNEQLQLLADESQKASARQAEKLQCLVNTCDERLLTLDQRTHQAVADAADTIARRAQAATAEAEKLLATQEAQSAATSKQLDEIRQTAEHRLCTRGESIREELDKLVDARLQDFEQRIRKSVAEHLDRVTGAIGECAGSEQSLRQGASDAQDRLGQLERMTTEFSAVIARAEEASAPFTQRIAEAEAAKDTLQTLTTKAAATVQRGEEALDRRQTAMVPVLDEAKTISESLARAVEVGRQQAEQHAECLRSAAETEKKLGQATGEANETCNAAAAAFSRTSEAAAQAETLAAKLEQQCAQATDASAAAEATGRKLQEDARSLTKFGASAIARHRQVLGGAIDEAKRVTEELQGRSNDADQKVSQLAGVVRSADAQGEKLVGLNTQAESLVAGMHRTCADTNRATEENATRIKQVLTETVGKAEASAQSLQDAIDTAKQTSTQLSGDLHQGSDLHERLSQSADHLSSLLDSAGPQADALAALSSQARNATEAAEVATKRLDQEVNTIVGAGEKAAAEQSAAVESMARQADSLTELVKRGVEAAERKCEQISSQTHAAVEAESALCRITATAHEVGERVDRAGEPLHERITQASALVDGLGEACTQANEIQSKTQDLNDRASAFVESGEASLAQHHDVLFAAIVDAKECMDDLRSSAAGVSRQQEKIAEQHHETMASATEAAEQVDALANEVRSLATEAEQRTRELAAEARGAGELLGELGPIKAEVESLGRDVLRDSETGSQLIEHLKTQIGSGDETSGRLETILDGGIRLAEDLAIRCGEAESIAERISKVSSDLQMDHETVVANQRILEDLNQQGESLGRLVQQAQVTTEALEVRINNLLSDPKAVVCDAKQQAIQLTDVCRTIKKVFSELSKTTLDATEKIDRLGRMTEVLQQWTGEAAHVQKRLESTIERAPDIAQTHPPAGLYSLPEPPTRSRPAAPKKARTGSAKPKKDRQPETVEHGANATRTERVAHLDSGRRISPDQVASLIADAKRQREREKQPTSA